MDDLDLGQTVRGFKAGENLFGRYTLKAILGRGGMGIVWLALDEKLEREVALKFLPDLLVHEAGAFDELKRETRRSFELTHHNIVRIYDFASDARSACIAMEYVDGPTLSALRVQQPNEIFEVNQILGWVEQICEALEYAHARAKIVHRDLKPANLMLNSKGELKVTDFGIARSLNDSVSMLTQQRGASGTLVYMSPQQLDGERASPLDDIYSLGATIYELLTGKPPFYSGSIERQTHDKLPPRIAARRLELGYPSVSIPDNWEEVIAACLAKDPTQRPAHALAVVESLRAPSIRPLPVKPPAPDIVATRPNSSLQISIARLCLIIALPLLAVMATAIWYFGFHLPRQLREITEQQKVNVENQAVQNRAPASGAVLVNTIPAGAAVTLAGKRDKTPTSFPDISPGPAHLEILLDGYEPVNRDIEVKENQITNLGVIQLKRVLSSAQIVSLPEGIAFDLIDADGARHSGITPALLSDLSLGGAEVTYRPPRSSAHTERIKITAEQAVVSWGVPATTSSPQAAELATTTPATTPLQTARSTPAPSAAPTPTPETIADYTYTGKVGPYDATFHLTFGAGERVTGTYTMPVDKDLVLRLEGRNPKGKLFLDEYTHDKLSAHIELTLSSAGNEIKWEGTMYNTAPDNRVFPVSFKRSR